ncbi:MAG: permease [Acidobacteria bacterium]|nr:permease [Acidobacteriota bacterium]
MSHRVGITAGFLLLVLVGSLVAYKTAGAARQLEHARTQGSVVLAADVVAADAAPLPLRVAAASLNYVAAIWPALVFGILISAAVHAYIPAPAVAALFGGGLMRRQVVAGACGVPLMLCSCCAAPLFSAVYDRSRRLAPSLALLLAAPALNPAALALTFLLFPGSIAWGRLWMSVAAVFIGTALVPYLVSAVPASRPGSVRDNPPRPPLSAWTFLNSSLHVTSRTVPLILLGVVAAMLVAEGLQPPVGASPALRFWLIAVTAAVAVPMALPTFFEIPLSVTLLAAGAPAGAAAALLFAGPAVNLASLLTVGQAAGWRAVWAVGAMVWLIALLGGLSIG